VREERPILELYAPQIVIHPGDDRFHITEEQCRKTFDWLVADGYFERASELLEEKKSRKRTPGPFYELAISVGAQAPMYHASIGWGKDANVRLKALQALLDGPPVKVIERMIKAASADPKATSEETRHPRFNGQNDVPSGKLGFPLGTYLTVEGHAANAGFKVNPTCTLVVDTVNGKRLEQPMPVVVEDLNIENPLPQHGRVVIKGYELGKMIGTPPGAIEAAKEAGKDIALPQAGWQFYRFFVLTSWVQPKRTEGQEDKVEPDDAPKGSKPIPSETNRRSSAAGGSRR